MLKFVESYAIRSIGNGAFGGNRELTSVTIPNGVTSIGVRAFQSCSYLTAINLPEGVTSIGNFAFSECSGLTSITFPEGLTSIGDSTFFKCYGLTSISLPKGLTSIGEQTFMWCDGLIGISLPEGLTSIGKMAFMECYGLTSISFPEGLTSIGDDAFLGCYGLTSISLPEGLTSIGDSAFWGCSGLTSVTIPGSVSGIGAGAFGYFGGEGEKKKVPDFTIYGTSGSEAERYAKDNGFTFRLGSGGDPSQGDNNRTNISKATVILDKTSYIYDGKAKTPSVTVKLEGKTLTLNTDYTVSYSDNINAGTAKVTVTGKGNYTGSKTVNFTIAKAGQDSSITCKKTLYKVAYGTKPFKINAASKSKLTFTSSKPKIVSVDKDTGKVTIKNTGVAIITIKAGKDSVKVTVKVSPKKQAVKSVNVSKGKKLTVKWAKDKTASGYQVQVSIDKKFKKGVKSKNLSKTSYTFTKLKAGKKYYVRMRSYKKSGKETLYSTWSRTKTSNKVKK